MDLIDFSLIHPFTCTLNGATMSGKTFFCLDLVKRRREVINTPINKVMYVYCDYQPAFHELATADPNVTFTNSIQDLNNLTCSPCLIVVDDQMDLISNNKEVGNIISNWFIKKAHHSQTSIICIQQNAFADKFININRNTNYTFFFDLQSDKSVLVTKGRQCCPGNPGFLLDAYQKSMNLRNFGYLMLEFHPGRTYKKYWVRSHLDPVPECEIYTPK